MPARDERLWQRIPVLIGILSGLFSFFGGVVAASVQNAHRDWIGQDHERRIAIIERNLESLQQINERLARIEGKLDNRAAGR